MFTATSTGPDGVTRGTEPHIALALCVERIARLRDRRAFEELFAYYGPRLKTVLSRGGLEAASAEDVVQDIMLTVWSKAVLYDAARGTVSAWIFRIARNARIDRLRRRGLPAFDITEFDLPSDAPAADQGIVENQYRRRVSRALDCLPAEQLEVIRLAFVGDLSQSEIASALSIPLGTVKSRMRLAYQKLRQELEGVL